MGLHGVAITRSLAPDAVSCGFVREGWWCAPERFGFEVVEGKPVSLDRKLRDVFARVAPLKLRSVSGRSTWRCSPAGITPPGATANGWRSTASTRSLSQSGQCDFGVWRVWPNPSHDREGAFCTSIMVQI